MKTVISLVMVLAMAALALADTPRERYDAADMSVNGGNGYKDYNNETATLAWGESYIMMSYVSAYESTGDTYYLDKLADHADHVLLNRDDERGVTDYRGVSGACWRNLHYQPNDEPYCYVVHSGMIANPMAAFVRIVRDDPSLWDLTTYDGMTYLAKADLFSAAVYETLAFHEDQWVDSGDAGYYIFRSDATFLEYAGEDLPLNQGNGLGRAIVNLGVAEDDAALLERSARMARWFEDQLKLAFFDQAYLWNYWGGNYSSPGEDISHAAINADFGRLCGEAEIVFDAEDLGQFANTFSRRIYESSEKRFDHIGGSGSYNTPSYTVQTGRWLGLSRYDATIYSAVRNQFDAMVPATTSGSVLLGFANVLYYDLPEVAEWYFTMDGWEDLGDYRVPISEDAGIYFLPAKENVAAKIAVTYESDGLWTVKQVKDEIEEVIARFGESAGEPRTLFLAHHPEWLGENNGYGALFLCEDVQKVYEGVAVAVAATITSDPPLEAVQGEAYAYQVTADGTMPIHFSATIDGVTAEIDKLSGLLTHTFEEPGEYEIIVKARNTSGADQQQFSVVVEEAVDDDTTDDDTADDDVIDDDIVDDDVVDDDATNDDVVDDDIADDDVADDDLGDDDVVDDDADFDDDAGDDDDAGCGC